ncbi:MAG: hypothetical protein ACR2MC_02005 [Actinomycetota bacterium]
MGMFAAYYDASGAEGDSRKPLVVAGLISTVLRWRKFERDWNRVLADPEFNVPYLHMKEFAHSQKGSPFESWKGNEEKRKQFLDRLRRVIKRRVHRATLMYLPLEHFTAVNERYRLQEVIGGPYSLAAVGCFGHVDKWVKAKHPGDHVEHIFEAGDKGQRIFEAVSKVAGYFPIIRRKFDGERGTWITPLQAADWFAYEYALELMRRDAPGERRFQQRGSWQELHWHIPCIVKEYSMSSLTRLCEKHPATFPPRVHDG